MATIDDHHILTYSDGHSSHSRSGRAYARLSGGHMLVAAALGQSGGHDVVAAR